MAHVVNKARKISGTQTDPTMPKTPITIDGKEYNLCFDFGALAEAESALTAEGHNVNLLAALPQFNLSNTRIVFAAALRTFHPEIGYEQAFGMVNFGNVYTIAGVIADAWEASLPKPESKPGNALGGE